MTKNPKLVRGLGVLGLSVTIFNCTVGGGIFRLPGTVYAITQTWTPLVYLMCGFLMILIGLCFVLVGRQTMETGGPYAYTKQAFGPFAGFISGALLWILGTSSTASVLDALMGSIAIILPSVQVPLVRALLIILIMGSLALINARGIKRGAIALNLFTILKVVALGVLIIAGFAQFQSNHVTIQEPFEATTFARTCMILMFAYLGLESALVPGGEIENPRRTIPISVIVSISCITLLYFLIQIACQSALGPALAEHADAPLVYAGEALFGAAGKMIVLTGSVFSMLGFLMGMTLAIPRIVYILAKDGYLPKKLKTVNKTYFTPNAAIILQCALVAGFAMSGSFNTLAIFANLSTVLLYIFCILASAKIYFATKQHTNNSIAQRFGILLMMLISIAIMSWFLTSIKAREWISMAIICLLFAVIYSFQFRNRSKKLRGTS